MDSLKISPNPFTDKTVIEFSSNQNMDNVKLGIFDVLGHEVLTIIFGSDNKVILSRDNLSNGIYFYRVFQKDKLLACGKLSVE
jgi:hypothetical protein